MLKRPGVVVLVMLVVVAGGASAWAQTPPRDRVVLTNGERLSGSVLKESWKGIELDKDMDGTADVVYKLEEVEELVYGDRPKYMEEAGKLRGKPESTTEYINTLKRAYFDRATSKWQLQHAYYELAKQYEELSARDDQYLPKALDAYQKLLDDIPETRYALQLRMDLGEMFLSRGELERSRKNFQGLIGGGFGREIETLARFRQAQTYLLQDDPDGATKVLNQLDAGELDGLNRAKLTVLTAEVLLGRGRYDEAFDALLKVLSRESPRAIQPEVYVALGDVFRVRGRPEDAMLAYLRAYLMYDKVDSVTQARALVGMTKASRRMNRKERVHRFRTELLDRFPGSLWEEKLKQ